MVTFNWPAILTEDPEFVYQDNNATITIESTETEIRLKLHINSHYDFPEIAPKSVTDCAQYETTIGADTITELPETYQSMFKAAVEIVKDKYQTTRKETNRFGECIACKQHQPTDTQRLVFCETFIVS